VPEAGDKDRCSSRVFVRGVEEVRDTAADGA
jgi:hypothetical protein